jgi:hypothetical protein
MLERLPEEEHALHTLSSDSDSPGAVFMMFSVCICTFLYLCSQSTFW